MNYLIAIAFELNRGMELVLELLSELGTLLQLVQL